MTRKTILIVGTGVHNYLLQSQAAMEIMNREDLQLIHLDEPPLDDTIWVNGEQVKIDPDRPIDFTQIEDRVIRWLDNDGYILDPHLTGDGLKRIRPKPEKQRPEVTHPRESYRGRRR